MEIRCNRSGAAVTVDGQALAATPLPRPVWVEPGSHQVTLEWEGEEKSGSFAVAAAQTVSLGLDFGERQPLPPPVVVPVPLPVSLVQQSAPRPRSLLRSTWLWVGAGALVAVVGTSLILIYGRSEHFPSTGFGTQTIGGGP